MKPLLAHIFEPHRVDYSGGVWLQDKLNGVRALSQGGFFQSRDELPWPAQMLDHIGKWMTELFPKDWVLDGELYVHGWPLQKINGAIAVNRQTLRHDTEKVEYHIFDRVDYNAPFERRYVEMCAEKRGLLIDSCPIKFVRTVRVFNEWDANDFYATAIGRQYEGMMYRIGDCPYTMPKQPGHIAGSKSKYLSDKKNRVWHMLKRKDWHDEEFTCVRVEEGEGKRHGMVGALICELSNGHYFGVGSGLTEAECIHYYENPPIGRKVKVKYLVLTSDGIPFNPTVIAVL